jgi:hypothetical protein
MDAIDPDWLEWDSDIGDEPAPVPGADPRWRALVLPAWFTGGRLRRDWLRFTIARVETDRFAKDDPPA